MAKVAMQHEYHLKEIANWKYLAVLPLLSDLHYIKICFLYLIERSIDEIYAFFRRTLRRQRHECFKFIVTAAFEPAVSKDVVAQMHNHPPRAALHA